MVDVRFIEESEIVAFSRAIQRGFGEDDERTDDEVTRRFHQRFPLETCIAAFDRGHVVGTFGSFDFDLTVPGGTLPMAGTTVVTVHPTHRRRGLLTRMMSMHLDQAVERRQPLAGLWASEEVIYGRFGYGQACFGWDLTIPTDKVTLAPAPGDVTLRPLTVDESREQLLPLYDRIRLTSPGMFTRTPDWWEARHFEDDKDRRNGASGRRHVLAERGDEAVGYVVYRQHWGDSASKQEPTAQVVELLAVDDDARRALWHFLTGVDLFPRVRWWNAPIDEPVLVEVDRPRLIERQFEDTLWLRILDVGRALEARTYESDGRVVLEVTDSFRDDGGRFALEVADGKAACTPTDLGADVALDIADLGALYLGGRSAHTLARAGKLVGSDDAVRGLDRIFRTARQPACIEVF